jgi:redox-sensitive bicupin YhaK (pirin superfamily)
VSRWWLKVFSREDWKMKAISEVQFSQPVQAQNQVMNQNFRSLSLNGQSFSNFCDPVINVDHFFMSAPTFPPHPHAGFSAVTYMLENSAGGFRNQDSQGNRSLINPGDLHWTLAGAGVVHEEIPATSAMCEGLQIFVNLSGKNKLCAPAAFRTSNESAPRVQVGNMELKVVAGSYKGVSSTQIKPEEVFFYQLTGVSESLAVLELPLGLSGLIYVLEGEIAIESMSPISVKINHGVALRIVGEGAMSQFHALLSLKCVQKSQFVVILGKPTNEPVMARGPFIMNSDADLNDAFSRYRSGAMGNLRSMLQEK